MTGDWPGPREAGEGGAAAGEGAEWIAGTVKSRARPAEVEDGEEKGKAEGDGMGLKAKKRVAGGGGGRTQRIEGRG